MAQKSLDCDSRKCDSLAAETKEGASGSDFGGLFLCRVSFSPEIPAVDSVAALLSAGLKFSIKVVELRRDKPRKLRNDLVFESERRSAVAVLYLGRTLSGWRFPDIRACGFLPRLLGLNRAQNSLKPHVAIGSGDLFIAEDSIRLEGISGMLEPVSQLEPARTAGKEVIWADDPSLGSLGVQIRGLNPREARKDFLETFLWCIETLPARDHSIDNILEGHAQNARTQLAKINCPVVDEASPQP